MPLFLSHRSLSMAHLDRMMAKLNVLNTAVISHLYKSALLSCVLYMLKTFVYNNTQGIRLDWYITFCTICKTLVI